MRQYHELMDRVLREGIDKSDRTGTVTRSVLATKCVLIWPKVSQ